MTESFAELFEQSQALIKLKPGTIVSGIVVDIKSDVPPCKSDPCEIFVPAAEAQYVLETKAGLSKVVGFNVGDELKFQ